MNMHSAKTVYYFPHIVLSFFIVQIFVVQLTSATGGATLLDYTQATITILGNDNPFGIISLQSPSSMTTEVGDNGTSVAMISVIRE